MIYGLFILKNGAWELVQTYLTFSNAALEREYLVKAFNIKVAIFKKLSA